MGLGRTKIFPIHPLLARFRALSARSWRSSLKLNVLLVTGNSRIEQSQIYPYYYYLKELERRFSTDIREIDITLLNDRPSRIPSGAHIVLFQPWFKLGAAEIVRLLSLLRSVNPAATMVYLDSAAPVDLRFAQALEPVIDLYVKKHVFRDRGAYGRETQGDTSLIDYYEKLYDLPPSAIKKFPVSEAFLGKLLVGPSFFTSNVMLPVYHRNISPITSTKRIRLHARLGCSGTNWYQTMRKNALAACEPVKLDSVITSDRIGYRKYIRELSSARLCFSPFGFGEVCWRDFEAITYGALMIKPDMSHVETNPDIFIPGQTYVSVKWDFSDVAEKVEYYLTHEKEADEIVQNAFRVLRAYCLNDGFVQQQSALFSKKPGS